MNSDQPMINVRYINLYLGLGIFWLLAAGGLLFFELSGQTHITIEWTTATEQNTAGFQLYRRTTPDGEFLLITKEIIPSQGNALSGSSYKFEDTNVTPGETYDYLLEEIEYDNTINQYTDDIISGRAPFIEWWAIVLIALLTLVGISFIVTGFRQGG